ncbi:MAG: hypothetical protein AB1757_30235 [Acidobacteriota bacterium]
MKIGNSIVYKDPVMSGIYGIGVVMSVTDAEYTILWAQRGSKKYKRSILDEKLDDIFQREDREQTLPQERLLQLGASKDGVSFNENYDRDKVQLLCEELIKSEALIAKKVAKGLNSQLFTKKLTLRTATKTVLLQLAQLCRSHKLSLSDTARQISQELFFGYILQESDFDEPEKSASLN